MKRASNKEALSELETFFLEGSTMTMAQMLEKFFPNAQTNLFNYIIAKKTAKGWLATLKKRFWIGYDEWFGCINEQGQYGIPKTKAELFYALERYRKNVYGNVTRAHRLYTKGIDKKLISPRKETELFLPIMEPEEVVEEKHELQSVQRVPELK